MRLLIRAHGHEDVEAAVIEFDLRRLLALMDKWVEIKSLLGSESFKDFRLWDGRAEWMYISDHDVLEVLDHDPLLVFDDIDMKSQRTECDMLIVDGDSVYWQAIVKHTDMRVETNFLTREYLEGLKTPIEHMKEAIDDTAQRLDTGRSGPDDDNQTDQGARGREDACRHREDCV